MKSKKVEITSEKDMPNKDAFEKLMKKAGSGNLVYGFEKTISAPGFHKWEAFIAERETS